jgi:DNA-binding NtrC family response regulator
MVHGFVHQSGGQIEVASEPGEGTTFRLYLPAAENTSVEQQPNAVPARASRGHETVLLVEDEDAVRALLRLALASVGYHVLEASDGQHALDVAARHDRDIHLLVTDMVMPRMNGRVLIERLKCLRPQLRVIAISGYPGVAGSHEPAFGDGVAFLQKPFATTTLVNLAREVLDRIRTSEAARCADGARRQS